MNSRTDKTFYKLLNALPSSVRKSAIKAYKLWSTNPYHPSLSFKRIHSIKYIYSVRINDDYRALGLRKENTIYWFWIGPHNEYEKIIKQL